jgi:hypothetical protein
VLCVTCLSDITLPWSRHSVPSAPFPTFVRIKQDAFPLCPHTQYLKKRIWSSIRVGQVPRPRTNERERLLQLVESIAVGWRLWAGAVWTTASPAPPLCPEPRSSCTMPVWPPARRVLPLLVSVQVKSPTDSQSVWLVQILSHPRDRARDLTQCAARHMGTVICDTWYAVSGVWRAGRTRSGLIEATGAAVTAAQRCLHFCRFLAYKALEIVLQCDVTGDVSNVFTHAWRMLLWCDVTSRRLVLLGAVSCD